MEYYVGRERMLLRKSNWSVAGTELGIINIINHLLWTVYGNYILFKVCQVNSINSIKISKLRYKRFKIALNIFIFYILRLKLINLTKILEGNIIWREKNLKTFFLKFSTSVRPAKSVQCSSDPILSVRIFPKYFFRILIYVG